MFAEVKTAAGRKLPAGFAATVATATLRRFRAELRAMPRVAQALTWTRGPKCVASFSSYDRICASLESIDLIHFFEPYLFPASEVKNGKPASDLSSTGSPRIMVRPTDCVVVEDSIVGVADAITAGITAIGFVADSHTQIRLGNHLRTAGARAVISDMRALKRAVMELGGW